MLILFYLAMSHRNLTYKDYLDGCGASGTDAAMLEVGRSLCQSGHQVYILVPNQPAIIDYDTGIVYLDQMPSKAFVQLVDVFCPLWCIDQYSHTIVQHIRHDSLVLMWLHCFMTDQYKQVLHQWAQHRQVETVVLTPYQVQHATTPPLSSMKCHIVPNGLNKQLFEAYANPCPVEQKRGNFTFHACFERGGAVASATCERLPVSYPKTFHIASYCPISYTPTPITKMHGNLSKVELIQLMNACDYFVYPLTLPNPPNSMHIDTWGLCIMEAMCCGVLVVTWDVESLRRLYGERLLLVPAPEHPQYNRDAAFTYNPNSFTDHAVDLLVGAVMKLEADPERKERMRRENRSWALQHTWDKSIQAFENILGEKHKNLKQ